MTEPANTDLSLGTVWRMTRPGFLVVTAVACVLGFASAAACGCGFDLPLALATLVLAVTAHAGANVLNDYEDAVSGADARNTAGLFPFTGGSRLIQQGVVSLATTRAVAWTLLGLVALGGVLLAVQTAGGLLLIGLAGVGLAWAYSSPPLRLMSRGWGEAVVAIVWWLVVIGADYVQRQHFFLIPAYSAVSFALLVANILLVNGLPDAEADRAVGKHTLAVRLGPRRAAALYALLAVLAHAWLVLGVWALVPPLQALWGLVSLPVSLVAAALVWRHAQQPQRLRLAIVLTIVAAVLHGLGMAGGLVRVAL
jgi:1,4-dihydroxy-2-naphthoate polyprenyltransferase